MTVYVFRRIANVADTSRNSPRHQHRASTICPNIMSPPTTDHWYRHSAHSRTRPGYMPIPPAWSTGPLRHIPRGLGLGDRGSPVRTAIAIRQRYAPPTHPRVRPIPPPPHAPTPTALPT